MAAAPQPVVVERSDSPDFVHVETTMTQSPAVDKEAAQLPYEMPETAENQAVDVGAEEPDAAAELETPDEKKNKKKKNKKKK